MRAETSTLGETIERLARETGATASFVEKIRALFASRGIPLAGSDQPWRETLEHAFRGHAAVRHHLAAARARLASVQIRLGGVSTAGRDTASTSQPLSPGDFDRCVVPGPEGRH